MPILTKIFGDSHQKYLKSLEPLVLQINSLEAEGNKNGLWTTVIAAAIFVP